MSELAYEVLPATSVEMEALDGELSEILYS